MKTVRLSPKGELTIPKKFRNKLNINAGDEVLIFYKGEELIIKPKHMDKKALRGLLRNELDLEKANEFLLKERKKWRI